MYICMTLLTAAFTVISVCLFGAMEERSGHVGVRFREEVISPRQLEALYEQDGSEEQEELPEVTLWKKTENAEAAYPELNREVRLKLIEIWGDIDQIYPGCLAGGAPLIREDGEGCMLSEAAAYQLFGGTDVLGMSVVAEDREYIIRGLLDIPEEILVRENEDAAYTYIEAYVLPREGTERLRQMLMAVGAVPEEAAVIEADTINGVLGILWLLPALSLLSGWYHTGRCIWKERKFRLWIMRIMAGLIAVLLIRHSFRFSADFIPSKWSDFEFFAELFKDRFQSGTCYF